jgi:4-amino-4-deoxy-L-arabinose transferase-like glycosyltransferase
MHVDEPWLAEQSYYLSRDGYVHSNFFRGIDRNDEYIVVYHRLFIQAQSRLFQLLGLELLSARLVSILAGTLLLILMALYGRRRLGFGVSTTLAAVLTLLLIPQWFLAFKIARPEMLVALLGFASFVSIERAGPPPRSLLWAAAGGVLAGGAMLSHLYGSIFVAAGFIALLARRRFPEGAAFALAALLALAPYALDVARHRALFDAQFHGQMVSQLTTFSLASPFVNLAKEHQRLFRMPQIIFPSTLFFGSLALGWRYASPRIRFLAGYTLVLMVALGAIAARKEVRYATYLSALEVLIIAGMLSHLPAMSGWRRRALLSLAAIFVVSGLGFNTWDLRGKTRFAALHREVARQIPDGAWCLTPMPLLFNEVLRLNLVSTVALKVAVGPEQDAGAARSFLASRGIQYVVAMRGAPSDSLLHAMEPLTLVSEGAMEGSSYRVFKVAYPVSATLDPIQSGTRRAHTGMLPPRSAH